MYRLREIAQAKNTLVIVKKIRQNCVTTVIWGIVCVICCYIPWQICDIILATGLGFIIGISIHSILQLKKLLNILTGN